MRRKKLPAAGDNWTTNEGLLKSITAVIKERNSCPALDVKAVWCLHFSDGTYEYIDEDDL